MFVKEMIELIPMCVQKSDFLRVRSRRVSEAKSGSAVRSGGDSPGPTKIPLINIPCMKAYWY